MCWATGLPSHKNLIMHVYKCTKNCNIRIYPFWVGDEGELCPNCKKNFMMYEGDKTQEELDALVKENAKSIDLKDKKTKK